MIRSITATHLATIPIDWYIAIKSTVHPPSTRDQKACCRLTVTNEFSACFVYCSVKLTVTVMMTGTGTPLSVVGVNTHCFTASSAAASSSAIDRSTFASCTRPSGPIVASMITTPCTRADWAIDGYTGLTSLIFVGGLILPPTRTGAGGGGG